MMMLPHTLIWELVVEKYVPSALGFKKGDGDRAVDKLGRRTLTGRNSEVLVPMFFLHIIRCLTVFDLVAGAASERHTFYALWSST